jgi:predicted transcriptional regulator
MSDVFRLKMARQMAEKVLRDEGIETLPVNPLTIAAKRDIVVEAKPDTVEGVSGMLLRHGNAFGILYATKIPSAGFQRFSISHELGHYFLDGHIDHVLPNDGFHASHAGFVSGDPYEIEADYFAAGLLMPSSPFRRALNKVNVGLSAVEAMASHCETSLTATAIRYADLTSEAVAVIISTGQTIDYCFLSESMRSLPELSWLRKGSVVPNSTETARMNAHPERVLRAERVDSEIDVMDWLGGTRSVVVTEEVVGLGRYGKTLTVLSSESIGHETDEDDEEDEDLIESWTPRFRR